jgi:hypothetical protein
MVERIYRKREVRRLYGNPPLSTFDFWVNTGRVPKSDFQLGAQTPGWTEGLLARHQAAHRRGETATKASPPQTTE